jgi:hypothetical protein
LNTFQAVVNTQHTITWMQYFSLIRTESLLVILYEAKTAFLHTVSFHPSVCGLLSSTKVSIKFSWNSILISCTAVLDQTEFCENRFIDGHTLRQELNETLSAFSLFLDRLGWNLLQVIWTKLCWNCVNFVKIDAGEVYVKLHLLVYRKALWLFKSTKRLGNICVGRHELRHLQYSSVQSLLYFHGSF